MRRLLRSAVLALLAVGCHRPAAPYPVRTTPLLLPQEPYDHIGGARRVAVLRMYGTSDTVRVPARVRAGDTMSVSFTVYGTPCVLADTTVVRMEKHRAVVTPYQRVHSLEPDAPCSRALRPDRRVVRVVFKKAGAAQVVVIGRWEPAHSWVVATMPVRVE